MCLLLHLYSLNHQHVEQVYSRKIFPAISGIQRFVLGWIPFSIGDLLYLIAIIWAIAGMVRFIRNRIRRKPLQFSRLVKRILNLAAVVYLLFNLLWGLNYNRTPVLAQMGIEETAPERRELLLLNALLVKKVNEEKAASMQSENFKRKREMLQKVHQTFLQNNIPVFHRGYGKPSLKPALFSFPGNFLGFTGYYNPFSGEAQVNTTIPHFLQPFTASHEVAHQLGFAKEMEANFVGFLVLEKSDDPRLRYSAYLDMFLYANRNLFRADSALARQYRERLSLPVSKDIEELRRFSKKYHSFLQTIFQWGYGIFLQRNQQPQGIWSYDEVTTYLVAWYKSKGELENVEGLIEEDKPNP